MDSSKVPVLQLLTLVLKTVTNNVLLLHHCRDDRTSMDGGTGSLRVRKFRQEDYRDDSDEDGTYNGNSTQQK